MHHFSYIGDVHTAPPSPGSVRIPSSCRRARRRGPRSIEALARRSLRATGPAPGAACGQSRAYAPECTISSSSFLQSFNVSPSISIAGNSSNISGGCTISLIHINIRGFISHQAQLTTILQTKKPDLVALNETFLDPSVSSINMHGYDVVSRLDRRNLSGWGDILLLAKSTMFQQVVHVGDSDTAERSWHVFHSMQGPILLGIWYRPPCRNEVATIHSLSDEIDKFGSSCIGRIIVGDINVHHIPWLRHSNGSSLEGETLYSTTVALGLKQLVRPPTRNIYLWDLLLTDLDDRAKVTVCDGISDHNILDITLLLGMPTVAPLRRKVLLYNSARWKPFASFLNSHNWSDILHGSSCPASSLHDIITEGIRQFIPSKWITETKGEHPWFNEQCRNLVRIRDQALGSPDFLRLRDECSAGILREYYVPLSRAH